MIVNQIIKTFGLALEEAGYKWQTPDASAESLQIVKTIMELARNLGMEVVAEGAELASQVAQLKAMGCEFVQSFYFSEPVELAAATALLTRPGWPEA